MPGILGETRIGSTTVTWGARTLIMGVMNITPDSFSGDGLGARPAPETIAARAAALAAEGADILDIGGESTRPGSVGVSAAEELARVIPAVEAAAQAGVPISVDTWRAEVADAALAAGAALVNDVTGLTGDPDMARLVAERAVPVVIVHNPRGPHGPDLVHARQYRDLVSDVLRWLGHQMDRALAAGVTWERILLDPGIGFGKSPAQNLELLRRLPELRSLRRPLVIGASRKRTIARALGLPPDAPAGALLEGNAAWVALSIAGGADVVRVHDVAAMRRVARVADRIAGRDTPGADGRAS